MPTKDRTPKPLERKLLDLDAHLFLLRSHLHKPLDSASHLKVIAAELRTLVCWSSGTEGLLWRMTKELGIADEVALHLPGKLNQDDPINRGLEFMVVPIRRAGKGHPQLEPDNYSLREVIKEGEALVAMGKPLTHEYLIKAVAQQMGTAHEDEGLEPALTQLSSIFINDIEPYIDVLVTDAELTLEVGERVLEAAEARSLLLRPDHSHDYGNVSVVIRLQRKQHLAGRVNLCRFHSFVSPVTVRCLAGPIGVVFELLKHGAVVLELAASYPPDADLGRDVIAVLSYCSRTREARTLTAAGPSTAQHCNLGWLHAAELELEDVSKDYGEMLEQRFLRTYERLLSSQDATELLALPPSGHGLWKYSDELQEQGVFPK